MGKKGKKESEVPSKEVAADGGGVKTVVSPQFDPLPIESRTPATVVLMLKSLEEEILVKACEALYKFAEKGDENRISLLRLGALPPLSRLITNEDRLVRRYAFMALGTMATNGEVKNALKKLYVIPSIVDKLSPEEETVVLEFATLCLASLSVDFVSKAEIYESKGLPCLIQLLSHPDPDVIKNSLDTLINLVQDHASREAMCELGGIPPLLELLKSDFPVIQHLSLKILQNVNTDDDTRIAFREEQGFEKLMDFLDNKDFKDLHVEALQVVGNCVADRESLQLIHEVGGLTRLMHFVLSPALRDIQSSAVKCIARAALDPENRRILHEHDMEKALVELLSVEGDSVKIAACHAVATMCLHPTSKDTFRDLDAIPAIVPLMSQESLELTQAAVMALSSLTLNDHDTALAVYEAEGDEILVQLLQVNSSSVVSHAAATLANMAEQDLLRGRILAHGALPALAGPLQSADSDILVQATRCLAVLTCDAEARAELHNMGCLPHLVSLLCSHHKDVRSNACWAISVCANCEDNTIEMCKHGALELLHEINSSVCRKNRFSELAEIRLLDSSLPVKYSMMGRLASTEITTDGFYDAGQVRPGHRVLTLKELASEPLNQHRPIFFVNAAAEVQEGPHEERHESPTETSRNSLSFKRGSATPRCLSRGRSKGKKEEEKIKDGEAHSDQHVEKPWVVPYDNKFRSLVAEVTDSILPLNNQKEQYIALARLVSKAMGGTVEMERLYELPWELHHSKVKFNTRSNIVPIGSICKGIYPHRAMLFKCLADRAGLSCTLVRGDYNRAWNEVLLSEGTPLTPGGPRHPCLYIVDLIHQPGNLMRANTPRAIQYQSI